MTVKLTLCVDFGLLQGPINLGTASAAAATRNSQLSHVLPHEVEDAGPDQDVLDDEGVEVGGALAQQVTKDVVAGDRAQPLPIVQDVVGGAVVRTLLFLLEGCLLQQL